VRALTDQAGTVTDTFDYDAFGNVIHVAGTTPNEFLFAGEQFDSNLNLYYNRARFFNTSTGRFINMNSADGEGTDPLSLHKYLYTAADPVNGMISDHRFSLWTIPTSVTPSGGSSSCAQRFREEISRLGSREILLASDQIAVAHGKPTPQPGLHVIGAKTLHFVFDAPWHDVLVARQHFHLPDRVVGEVFLDVGEAREGLSLRERLTIRECRVTKNRDAVTQRDRELPRFVELDELLVQVVS
jgi:RHS repeat-associated protein